MGGSQIPVLSPPSRLMVCYLLQFLNLRFDPNRLFPLAISNRGLEVVALL